jgi:hypothetical protein
MRQKLSSLWLRVREAPKGLHAYSGHEKISIWILTPLILFTLTQYIYVAVSKPFNDFAPLCFSATGLTLALSALCGQIASVTNKDDPFYDTLTYAGEKFLHCSLMLVQCLVVVFVKDAFLNSSWATDLPALKKIVPIISGGMAGLAATYGAYLWYWGFSALNFALWKRPRPFKSSRPW